MKGYTLIELIIVIGVLAILTGLASLSLVSFSKSSDIDDSASIARGALKEAQANSMAVLDDKVWGVHLEDNRLVVFSDTGAGFNPSDPGNSVRVLASKTKLTWNLGPGISDIEFSKRTGRPLNYGTLTLSGGSSNTKEVTINAEGMIEY